MIELVHAKEHRSELSLLCGEARGLFAISQLLSTVALSQASLQLELAIWAGLVDSFY